MRWKYIDSGNEEDYPTIRVFQNSHCLFLDRLKSNASWSDVAEVVSVFDDCDVPALVVSGILSGPRIKMEYAKVTVTFENFDIRDWCINSLRLRIAPWQLLYVRARKVFSLFDPSLDPLPAETSNIDTSSEQSATFNSEDGVENDTNSDSSERLSLQEFLWEIASAEEWNQPVVWKETVPNVSSYNNCVFVLRSMFLLVAACFSIREVITLIRPKRCEDSFATFYMSYYELKTSVESCLDQLLQQNRK